MKDCLEAQIDLIPSNQGQQAAARWQTHEQRIGNKEVTNSWPWTKTWIDRFGRKIPHTFAFATYNNETIGATLITNPLTYRSGSFLPIPSLFLGTSGEPPSKSPNLTGHRLLVEPQYLDMFAEGLIRALRQFRWNRLYIHEFVQPHAEALAIAAQNAGIVTLNEHFSCPVFDFEKMQGNGYTDVHAALPTNKRRLRNNRHKLSEIGPLQPEWAETIDQAKDIYIQLVDLNRRRWLKKGQAGSFPNPGIEQYYADLIDNLFPDNLSMFRLKAGDRTIGCIYSLLAAGKVLGYKSGFDFSDDISTLTPGIVTHLELMKESARRGYSGYEFGPGENEYKLGLSNSTNTVVNVTGYQGSAFLAARGAYRMIKDRLRGSCFIKSKHYPPVGGIP